MYRDSLHSHEKELERTSSNIKELIKEVKNLLSAAKSKNYIIIVFVFDFGRTFDGVVAKFFF